MWEKRDLAFSDVSSQHSSEYSVVMSLCIFW